MIWKAPRHESYFYQLLRGRVLSLALVIGLGVLLLASMVLATGIRLLGHVLDRYTDISDTGHLRGQSGLQLCDRRPDVRRHI